MAYNPRDFYFKKAKEQNFAARSIFKLEEIDKRFRIFRAGLFVLDLGCAPGSWSQYASKKLSGKGLCISVDLTKVTMVLPNVRFEQADAFDEAVIARLAAEEKVEQFDLVMSDMAPKTTGVRLVDQERSYNLSSRALEVARMRLKKGGSFIVKLFQSDRFEEYVAEVKKSFDRVEFMKPKSTRKQSYEIFITGLGYKGVSHKS